MIYLSYGITSFFRFIRIRTFDRWTDNSATANTTLHSMQYGKNGTALISLQKLLR